MEQLLVNPGHCGEQTCDVSCLTAQTSVAEQLQRFDRQARQGVFPGERYRLHYSVIGAGPPVYFVPGICFPRRLFAPLAMEMASSHRVVLYDLPGMQWGDRCRLTRYDLCDYGHDLLGLADHLGDKCFAVQGYSFGVSVALRAMASASARVAAAILIAGFARRPLTVLEQWMLRLLRHWPGRLGNVPLMGLITRYNQAAELDPREPGLSDFLVRMVGDTPLRAAAAQAMAVHATDMRQLAPEVENPIFLVHGQADRLITPEQAGELAGLLPKARLMLVPDAGHAVYLSHYELIARAGRRFLQDVGW